MGLGQVFKIVRMLLESCVVDQNIEAAELLRSAVHGLLAKLRIGDIARDGDAAAPLILDRRFFVCSASSCSLR